MSKIPNSYLSPELSVIEVPIVSLKPYALNARTHSKRQIRQIAKSINQFGFNNPILIDKSDTIVAGQGRVDAAKLLGIKSVPTIRLEDLSENEIRAYVIADNIGFVPRHAPRNAPEWRRRSRMRAAHPWPAAPAT